MQGADYLKSTVATLTTSSTLQTDARNIWVDYIAVCNKHASTATTVTISDANTKYLVKGYSVAVGETYHVPIPEGGLLFTGGVYGLASTASALDVWIRFRSV